MARLLPIILAFVLFLSFSQVSEAYSSTLKYFKNEPAQSEPFEVYDQTIGYVSFGNRSPFNQTQVDGIEKIELCITKFMPLQEDQICDTIVILIPEFNETVWTDIPVHTGYNYATPKTFYKNGYTNVSVPLGLVNTWCSGYRWTAGYNCEKYIPINMGDNATVELATEEKPMYVATDTTVRMPYNMTKSPTFASVLEIEVFLTDGEYSIQPLFSTINTSLATLPPIKGNSPQKFQINAPPFSRENYHGTLQYWYFLVTKGKKLVFTVTISFCDDPNLLSTSESPCSQSFTTFTKYDEDYINIPQQFNLTKTTYFVLSDQSSLRLASYNAEMTVYIDNVADYAKLGMNASFYDFGFPIFPGDESLSSTIVKVDPINVSEPVYLWNTWGNGCPFECNGKCNPGQHLCECYDGSYAMYCPDAPKNEMLFVYIGAGVLGFFVVVGIIGGVVVVKKRSKKADYEVYEE